MTVAAILSIGDDLRTDTTMITMPSVDFHFDKPKNGKWKQNRRTSKRVSATEIDIEMKKKTT